MSRKWRRGFGHAEEHPFQRLRGDWVKLVIAAVLLIASALHAGDVTNTETQVRKLFVSLPDGFEGLFDAVFKLGGLWAVGLVVVGGLLARRWRLAAALGLAGVTSWFLARLLALIVAGADHPLKGVFDGRGLPPFPAVRLAVIAAVLFTATPYLTRPLRRAGQILVAMLAMGTLYLGTGGANGVFAALVLAWGVAAAIHLLLGSPAGRPTTEQVRAALEELGIDASDVSLSPIQHPGLARMDATLSDGGVVPVKVYGRDAADTRFVNKALRWLMYKDSGPTLTFTRLQQVEHEALGLLVASRAGAVAPDLLAAGVAGPDAAILVTTFAGDPLDGADARATAALLSSLWQSVSKLRDAHLSHGALDADHLHVLDGTPVIIGFENATMSAHQGRLDQDVAQLLVTTAFVAGEEAALRSAIDGVGTDAVASAIPFLQRPALTRASQAVLKTDKAMLDRLRTAASEATGAPPSDAIELRRVKPVTLIIVAAVVLALYVILGEAGNLDELWATLKTADWPWIVVAFLLSFSTSGFVALALMGAVDTAIPFIPAVYLQWAVALTNLIAPTGAAPTIMNIRFLQKCGIDAGPAASTGVLVGISGNVAQLVLAIVTGIAVGGEIVPDDVSGGDGGGQTILTAIVVASVVVGVAYVFPKSRRILREKVWPQVVSGARNVWSILTNPKKLVAIFGNATIAQLLYAFCLLACVTAYGGHVSVAQAVFVYSSASFVACLIPVPGGVGITEALLVSGLTAFGVPSAIATAAALTQRVLTTYLPPLWGAWGTKKLISEGYL